METIAAGNAEAVEAWNGVLFDRFLEYRHIFTAGLGTHGDAAMAIHPPPAGGSVLDIGCGFGDTTQQLAQLIGAEGDALGIDAAPRFIELAEREAEEAGAANVRFMVCDPEAAAIEGSFDYAFSRMGTMFFANPVAALRNIAGGMAPGGQLNMVVWRRKLENEWAFRAEQVVEGFLEHTDPDDTDEPTCGPGPFSMANADTVSMQLRAGGFEEIDFRRSDLPMVYGRDVDEAVAVAMSLGPAGEIIRLAGERGEETRPAIVDALRELMGEYAGDDGAVRIEASCWIVSARVGG